MKRKNILRPHLFYWAMIFGFLLITLNACSSPIVRGGADVSQQQSTATTGRWTWVSGDSETDQRGVYGTLGVAVGVNKPGARSDAVSWIDSRDNLYGYSAAGNLSVREIMIISTTCGNSRHRADSNL